MKIEYSKKFLKKYKKASPKIQETFKIKLKTFLKNKYDRSLNYHLLLGKLKGVSSINLGGDLRVLFIENNKKKLIYFITIGSHSELYS